MQFTQGDVLVETCAARELNGAKETRPTLALGEATGHHHSFLERHVTGFFKEGDELQIAGGSALAEFVQIKGKSADLTHAEHGTIAVPPGVFKKTVQREYAPDAIRNVQD